MNVGEHEAVDYGKSMSPISLIERPKCECKRMLNPPRPLAVTDLECLVCDDLNETHDELCTAVDADYPAIEKRRLSWSSR